MSDIKAFPLRMPTALYESLVAYAEAHGRSVNAMIVAMLSDPQEYATPILQRTVIGGGLERWVFTSGKKPE